MERSVIPRQRLLNRNGVNQYASQDPNFLKIFTDCSLITRYQNEKEGKYCRGNQWQIQLRQFLRTKPGFVPLDPGYAMGYDVARDPNLEVNYDDFYFDYLAIKVQWNVNEILRLSKLPILKPRDFGFSARDFELTGFEGTRSINNEVLLRRARDLDVYLEEFGYPDRIIGSAPRTNTDVLTNLRIFFEKMERVENEIARLRAQCLSDSLVLASEINLECLTCRSVPRSVNHGTETVLQNLLISLRGIHSINDPATGQQFQTNFIQGYGMKNGSLLSLNFTNGSFYIIFVDLDYYEISGPYVRQIGVANHLPRLFLNYLRRKGLISLVAIELYPILAEMPVLPGDNWI